MAMAIFANVVLLYGFLKLRLQPGSRARGHGTPPSDHSAFGRSIVNLYIERKLSVRGTKNTKQLTKNHKP